MRLACKVLFIIFTIRVCNPCINKLLKKCVLNFLFSLSLSVFVNLYKELFFLIIVNRTTSH